MQSRQSRVRTMVLAGAGSAALVSLNEPVLAQETESAAPPPAVESAQPGTATTGVEQARTGEVGATTSEVPSIIVTARRIRENLQDVAVSATTFNEQELERSQVSQLRDLQFQVPGVTFTSQETITNPFITIRGAFTNTFTPGLSSPITLYVDGVLSGRSSTFSQDLGDVVQLEVLRGPQGTLFGRNTIGGAINITTRQPGREFEASLEGEVGNYDLWRVRGTVNLPLGEQAAVRVSAFNNDRDGFVRNNSGRDFQDLNNHGGRIQLRVDAAENLRLTFAADAQDDDVGGYASDQLRDTWAQALSQLGIPTPEGTLADPARRVVDQDGPHFEERRLRGVSGTIEYELSPAATLTSITAYRTNRFRSLQDVDAIDSNQLAGIINAAFGVPATWSVGESFAERHRQFTQEVRLASTAGRVRFVAGFFFLNETTDFESGQVFRDTSLLSLFAAGAPINSPAFAGPAAEQELTSYAAFANVDFLLSASTTLTAGLRYTRETADSLFRQAPDGFAPVFGFNIIPEIAPVRLELDNNDLSPMISLQHRFSDSVLAYAKVSRGFKAGGFDYSFRTFVDSFFQLPVSARAEALTFDPERATAYEAGLKTDLFGRRLRFNVAAFLTDYEDQQVRTVEQIGGIPVSRFVNLGSSRVWGFEADMTFIPVSGLRISGGLGYLNSDISEGPGAGGDLPRIPELSFNLGAQYDVRLTGSLTGFLRGELTHRGGVEQFPDDPLPLPSYTQVNIAAGLALNERARLIAYVRNVFDEAEVTSRSMGYDPFFDLVGLPVEGLTESYGAPRTYGMQLQLTF